jgi:uncharacterized protein (TIRG00374 family)
MYFIDAVQKRSKALSVFVLTLLVVVLLITQIDWTLFEKSLINYWSLEVLFAFLLYILSFALRAWRWQYLLKNRIGFLQGFHLVGLHTIANNLFPVRSGELTFPFFAYSLYDVPVEESTAALFVARVTDIFALIALVSVSYLMIGGKSHNLWFNPLVLCLFVAVAVTVMVVLFALITDWVIKKFPDSKLALKISDVKSEIIKSYDSKALLVVALTSTGIWLVKLIAFYAVTVALLKETFPISLPMVIFAGAVSEVVASLPLQTFAELGMFEAGWAGVLMFLGIPKKIAVTLGFQVHMAYFSFSLILGLPAYLLVIKRLRRIQNG